MWAWKMKIVDFEVYFSSYGVFEILLWMSFLILSYHRISEERKHFWHPQNEHLRRIYYASQVFLEPLKFRI